MRTSVRARRALVGLSLAALALPALGQDRPESILPPGFGEPVQPAPVPTQRPVPLATRAPGGATVQPLPTAAPATRPTASPTPTPTPSPIDPKILAEYELPSWARRSLDAVGPVVSGAGGLPADGLGDADGRYLETLMRRLDAPLPSRWLSILLRRTLASRLDTPAGVNGADFAAERAWLLLRMGESVAARAVVQGVDDRNHTPKLYQMAMQTALATGDPAAMCPLAGSAVQAAPSPGWSLALAMCAALRGEQRSAAAQISAARRRRLATGIDLLLAQKVVGAGAQGRQAVTIEWTGVSQLTSWRFGLATATGVTVPDELIETVGPQLRYWQALAPSIPVADRLTPAEAAAGQGVLSSAALVDLFGVVDALDDAPSAAAATARDLHDAYVANTSDARLAAIRALWAAGGGEVPYARLVLTARAAARVQPSAENPDGARLIAAMLSAGLDRTAERWRGRLPDHGDGWAMLALADPDGGRRYGYDDLSSYAGEGAAERKRQMLFAGLAGLGRLAPDDIERAAQALDVRIGTETSWTRALSRAVRGNQPATVALLAAAGMQADDWRGIPPAHLYHIVAALRGVGLTGEARMIAAEAIARL